MSPEGKVSGNGRKEKRMRRRNGGGVEMMGGIGIGKKDGRGSPKERRGERRAAAFAKKAGSLPCDAGPLGKAREVLPAAALLQ